MNQIKLTNNYEGPKVPELSGWESRYVGNEPKLSEIAQTYRELGFEVKIEDFKPTNCGSCTICFDESDVPIQVVYTRKK